MVVEPCLSHFLEWNLMWIVDVEMLVRGVGLRN